jgi:site-specific recombinase XerD
VCALRFLYGVTLGRAGMVEQIPFPRVERHLPVVLSQEELGRLFDQVTNLKHRTVLMLLYGGGLRLSEALGLRVEDVDGRRGAVHVRQGKGKRDR